MPGVPIPGRGGVERACGAGMNKPAPDGIGAGFFCAGGSRFRFCRAGCAVDQTAYVCYADTQSALYNHGALHTKSPLRAKQAWLRTVPHGSTRIG